MAIRFVTIARFINENDAEFCRSLLNANGFNSFVLDSNLPYTALLQRVRLQVPFEQAEAATTFLRTQDPPPPNEELEEQADLPEKPLPSCPQCGKQLTPPSDLKLGWRMWLGFLAGVGGCYFFDGFEHHGMAIASGLVAATAVGFYLLTRQRNWICAHCEQEDKSEF